MKKIKQCNIISTLVIFALFMFTLSSCNDNLTLEKRAVRKCFDDYRKSIIDDRFYETASFLDTRTIKYYDNIADVVRNGDSIAISKLKITDQIAILMTRVTAENELIQKFDGRSIFSFFIEHNFINKDEMLNVWIGDVEIDENFAKGQIDSENLKKITSDDAVRKKVNPYLNFYKENGKWKMNTLSIMKIAEPFFKKSIAEKGITVSEFLFSGVEEKTGIRPSSEIWKPIVNQ